MTFAEQLVRKKRTAKDILLLCGLWLLAFLIVVAMLYGALGIAAQRGNTAPTALAILLSVGVFAGAFRLSGNFTVEYEYGAFEGALTVDKIVAKRCRTRVVQVAAKRVERLLPIASFVQETVKFDRVLMAAPSKAEATYYITYTGKKNGHTAVLFAPSDEFFAELYKDQTREVKAACDKARKCFEN